LAISNWDETEIIYVSQETLIIDVVFYKTYNILYLWILIELISLNNCADFNNNGLLSLFVYNRFTVK